MSFLSTQENDKFVFYQVHKEGPGKSVSFIRYITLVYMCPLFRVQWSLVEQECIPVACLLPAHWPYLVVSHACSPIATMHTPLATIHVPPATMHPPCNHTCPPATTHPSSNHARLLATMHAPQQPCMPPSNNAHPLQPCTPPCNHAPPRTDRHL